MSTSSSQVLVALVHTVARFVPTLLRWCVIVFLWLILVPLGTCFCYRMYDEEKESLHMKR